ncbi:MAG: tetratricopeptide repeat protein, partial [Chloroflexota bacterium]|nr:tetratricopeptide repeat protein [Chloroflexota bacterium]
AASEVSLLVTSRERLNLRGEWVLDVKGLSYLPAPPTSLDDAGVSNGKPVESYSAVQLFLQSARRIRPGFSLSEAEQSAVAQICRLLAGMPLGIELAAAWVRMLSCEEVAQEIERNLDFLSTSLRDQPARHRSLRAVFDHSWDLLTEEEQRVFRKLSLFRGGFHREAAEQVAGATLVLLSSLMDKSLLRRTPLGRYEIHELLRQYAYEKLREAGEAEQAQEAHLAFFLTFAEEAEPHLADKEQAAWLARLEMEHDNLRTALTWSRDSGETEKGLRLTGLLAWFWRLRGHSSEGRAWLTAFLTPRLPVPYPGTQPSAPSTHSLKWRAKALNGLAWLAWAQSDYRAARIVAEESLPLWRELGDTHGFAAALLYAGLAAHFQGEMGIARARLEESVARFREQGDQWYLSHALTALGIVTMAQSDYATARLQLEEGLAIVERMDDIWSRSQLLNSLGDVARCQGEYGRAATRYEEALTLYRQLGNKWNIAASLHNLGHVTLSQGNCQRARTLFLESLTLHQEQGNKVGMVECLVGFGGVARTQGQPQRAARLFAAAEAAREAIGATMWPATRLDYERHVAAVHAALSQDKLMAAWVEGRMMTLEQALAYALEDDVES